MTTEDTAAAAAAAEVVIEEVSAAVPPTPAPTPAPTQTGSALNNLLMAGTTSIRTVFQLPETQNPQVFLARLSGRNIEEDGDIRSFVVGDPTNKKKFVSNEISTSKYSIWSFFPRFFFEQFGKASNFFFLFTACISTLGEVAVIPPPIAVSPLLIVLSITALKEIIEDIRRHRADTLANSRPVLALRNGVLVEICWKDVIVGDILKIEEDEPLCADVLLLSSSSPEGIPFIQTASLDGETNLKIRQGPLATSHLKEDGLVNFRATMECEAPNNRLYTFDGTLHAQHIPKKEDSPDDLPTEQSISVGPNEIILRGCTLKNTKWVYGLVFFTGHDTKLFKNAHKTPMKQSSMQSKLNRQIIFLFLIIMLFCITILVGRTVQSQTDGDPWYLKLDLSQQNLFFQFLSSILLLQNIIPIGLFVQLEIARFVQGWFITSDLKMYYEEKNYPARARTSNLNEDLGQISHIFSDKTGTLTQNKMVFRSCFIAGNAYGDGESAFNGKQLMHDLTNDPLKSEDIYNFLLILCVCHTVIPEVKTDETGTTSIQYQASSPDEYALVKAASELGFVFKSRSPGSLIVSIRDEDYEFTILQVNDFNSTRKRMSIVCRTPEEKVVLFCKGADNIIFERLAKTSEEAYLQALTSQALEGYSKIGLRTLCLAYRELTHEQYRSWAMLYNQASLSLENRAEKLEEAAELIEQDLHLLGCTAIEDKLQVGVPETLAVFARAGVKVWVLTGDKQETAINIGLSCNLLTPSMELMVCNGEKEWLTEFLVRNIEEKKANKTPEKSLALVIDGTTLLYALEQDLQGLFLELANMCGSVICCRVSPLQKAKVVLLVKDNTPSLTLAIGDGANDVSMIQAAHIGVGIHGEEGSQAARASEYSIGQFRFLRRLLMVHGSWSYYRQSQLIFYQFYIQILFNFITFYYQSVDFFSLQIIYQALLQTLFFTLFTGLPILMAAILDRHLPTEIIENYPEAYRNNITKPLFTIPQFWFRFMIAFIHTLIMFILVYLSFSPMYSSLWVFGSTMYTCVMLTLTLFLCLQITRLTLVDVIAMTASLVMYVISQAVVSRIPYSSLFYDYYGIFAIVGSSGASWFLLLLVPTTVVMVHLTYLYVRAYHFPTDTQILNEIDFMKSISVIQVRMETEVQRIKTATEAVRNRFEEFNEGVREAFTLKREPTKTEEDQSSVSVQLQPIPLPDVAGPSTLEPAVPTPAPSNFRKFFFPWTTYDFSMPEGDAMPQSTLIKIFSQHETAPLADENTKGKKKKRRPSFLALPGVWKKGTSETVSTMSGGSRNSSRKAGSLSFKDFKLPGMRPMSPTAKSVSEPKDPERSSEELPIKPSETQQKGKEKERLSVLSPVEEGLEKILELGSNPELHRAVASGSGTKDEARSKDDAMASEKGPEEKEQEKELEASPLHSHSGNLDTPSASTPKARRKPRRTHSDGATQRRDSESGLDTPTKKSRHRRSKAASEMTSSSDLIVEGDTEDPETPRRRRKKKKEDKTPEEKSAKKKPKRAKESHKEPTSETKKGEPEEEVLQL